MPERTPDDRVRGTSGPADGAIPFPRAGRILVVDLLGGIGDLVMVLPAVHALHPRHPRAELRVLTHAPRDELLRHDPALSAGVRAPRGGGGAPGGAPLGPGGPGPPPAPPPH